MSAANVSPFPPVVRVEREPWIDPKAAYTPAQISGMEHLAYEARRVDTMLMQCIEIVVGMGEIADYYKLPSQHPLRGFAPVDLAALIAPLSAYREHLRMSIFHGKRGKLTTAERMVAIDTIRAEIGASLEG